MVSSITDTRSPATPLARLGLLPIDIGEMAKVLIVYTVYHEIKVGNAAATAFDQEHNKINYPAIKQSAALAYKALQWNAKAHTRAALEAQRRTPRRPTT